MSALAKAQRILIVGHSGAGKSTLARTLGQRLNLPVTHLDQLYWKPGWVESDLAEFQPKVDAIVAGERWVIDGGYTRSLAERLARAQVVVWLDLPVPLLAWRIFKRWRQWRGTPRPDMNPGCPEKLDFEFAHWVLFAARGTRRRTGEILARHGGGVAVFRIRRPRQLVAILGALPDRGS